MTHPPRGSARGTRERRAEQLTNSSGLRTPNCTLLMVRSGHALSPEGGPPPCMARQARCAGANLATKSLRHRRLSAQNPSGRPPGRTSRNRERKAGGGKGGGGGGKEEGGETKRAERKPFLPFRRFVGSQKGNKRREERRRLREGGRRKGVTNK